jgi:predicted DNA binding CopG/RHH family protein
MAEKKDKYQLDYYEQEILDAYESGKLGEGTVSGSLVTAARTTMRKTKNINIRISENDLESIRLLAAREGLPYQTLIGSLIHKYATGSLKEAT